MPNDGAVCLKSLLLEIGDQEQTDLLNPNRITFKEAVLESLPKERDLEKQSIPCVVSSVVLLPNLEKALFWILPRMSKKRYEFKQKP